MNMWNRRAILGTLSLAAAAGVLSFGLLASNLASVATSGRHARRSGGLARPAVARVAESGRRRGRRERLPGHAHRKATGGRTDRAHAPPRRPMDELPGRVQRAQRRLLPRAEARAGRGGPESRPGCPGRGRFLTIPGSPRGRRRLRQRARRARARRPGRTGRTRRGACPERRAAAGRRRGHVRVGRIT